MANISKIRLSGQTYTIVDETAIHSLADYSTTAQMNQAITAATDALATTIAEQGYQTATDVQNAISGKADTSAVTAVNDALTAHTANTDIHVTVADRTAWNAKLDASDVENFFGAVNYDSQTKRINFYNESTGGTVLAFIDATDFVKDGFLSSVTIDNKTIEGQSVPCMVFIWNTDAGVQETDIPLSGIFNPSNYYDKTAIDGLLADKLDVDDFETYSAATETAIAAKQDELTAGTGIDIQNNVVSVTGVPLTVDDTVTSGSSNPVKSSGIYNAITAETSVKQDTLVNQTNIKSVGGESLLGSGNLGVLHAELGTGNDSETLIFTVS